MARRLPALIGLQRLATLAGTLVAVACATTVPKPAPPPAPAVTIPIAPPPITAPPGSGNPKFDAFLADARKTALAQGITSQTFDAATAGIAPIASIAAMNANQPEFSKPVWSYLDSAVSVRRIADAKLMLARYGDVLARIEGSSGIPKEILVAIWGMETDYGRDVGSYNVFATLVTQAYDGPRQGYARSELIAALRLLQQNDYVPSQMVSSWAGAIGQTQFMPSTFFKYATDGDGDGKIDLWHSPGDALASTAVLFQREGWEAGKPWGYEVRLPASFPYQDADLGNLRPLSEWTARGMTLLSGALLPQGDDAAARYLPAGAHGPALLLLNNFRQIMKYNNAASYALAVSLLADRMMDRPGIQASWPRGEKPLSRDDRLRFQTDLTALGYDSGQLDGLLGRKTRIALRQYQLAHGLPADAYPTWEMLARLDSDASKMTPITN